MASNFWDFVKKQIEPYFDPDIISRIEAIPRKNVNEFGVDPFGFDPEVIKLAAPIITWLYRKYFRCEVHGLSDLPQGRMMLVANHSGQLPFDGAMIAAAMIIDAPKPRLVRGMAERWSAELPFISSLFPRIGTVVGLPNSCKRLLEMDESVLVFPEGVRGINKLFDQRYHLCDFGQGFMRLALETKSPIVPVAVVGAEEQAAAIANIKPVAQLFGLPALPIVFPQLLPLPLPVKYRIYFGKPMTFQGDPTEDQEIVTDFVHQVKNRIQTMLNEGLKYRKSIFY